MPYDAGTSAALTPVRDELGRRLDVLVRSGIAAAPALEARVAEEGPIKKSASKYPGYVK
jgi:hypothetical protein